MESSWVIVRARERPDLAVIPNRAIGQGAVSADKNNGSNGVSCANELSWTSLDFSVRVIGTGR